MSRPSGGELNCRVLRYVWMLQKGGWSRERWVEACGMDQSGKQLSHGAAARKAAKHSEATESLPTALAHRSPRVHSARVGVVGGGQRRQELV